METDNIKDRPILFYFQVHQPRRLKEFQFVDINQNEDYFDDALNETILKRVAEECYTPANNALLNLIKNNPNIRVTFNISGTVLDQLEKYAPDALQSFKELAETGAVEIVGSVDHHSLAWKISETEFQTQVIRHLEKIQHHFGLQATTFAAPELIYNDDIGSMVARMGFNTILTESAPKGLARDNDFLFRHPTEALRIVLRQTKLSEDIVHRFGGGETVLNAADYTENLYNTSATPMLIAMSYETFGELHKRETAIADFLVNVLTKIVNDKQLTILNPKDMSNDFEPHTVLSTKDTRSWTDDQKDISAWLGNDLQKEAFEALKGLEALAVHIKDESLKEVWRQLQTCDHFYYMSTKKLSEGSFHTYYSHYPSPYEAYINYMNILGDLAARIKGAPVIESEEQQAKALEYNRQHPSAPVWAMKKEGNQHRNL